MSYVFKDSIENLKINERYTSKFNNQVIEIFLHSKSDRIINKDKDGVIYVKEFQDEKFLVKKRDCIQCSNYEYFVGVKLNHPNLAKTYCYFEYEGYRYFIQEYCEGENSSYFLLNTADIKEITKIILQFLMTVADIQSHYNFTHYDLHIENVILEKRKTPKITKFKCFGKIIEFLCEYNLKIIDFGYSHIDGVSERYLEESLAAVQVGCIPGVFDEMMDFATIFDSLIHILAYTANNWAIFSKWSWRPCAPSNLKIIGKH